MHELGLAREIVAIATERAEGARVTKVIVEVGKLAAVLPDALRFSFEAASAESPIAGAELELRETEGGELRVVAMEVV